MEKTAANKRKPSKAVRDLKQGIGDMISLPSYSKNINKGAIAGRGLLGGTLGLNTAFAAHDVKRGKGGTLYLFPSPKSVANYTAAGAGLGAGIEAGRQVSKIKARRQLAKSRRLKALGLLAAGAGAAGAHSMRKKKK